MTQRKTKPASPVATSRLVPVNPYEAFRLVVYGYSQGVKVLADRLGMSAGVLYNKADATVESQAQPTLRDLVAVTRETGDPLVLESLDRMFGRTGIALAQGPASDAALLELLAKVGSEHGQMCQALTEGLDDRVFTRSELEAVRSECMDTINALLVLAHRLEGIVDDVPR